jgi:hypothetical protein
VPIETHSCDRCHKEIPYKYPLTCKYCGRKVCGECVVRIDVRVDVNKGFYGKTTLICPYCLIILRSSLDREPTDEEKYTIEEWPGDDYIEEAVDFLGMMKKLDLF